MEDSSSSEPRSESAFLDEIQNLDWDYSYYVGYSEANNHDLLCQWYPEKGADLLTGYPVAEDLEWCEGGGLVLPPYISSTLGPDVDE